MIWPRDDWAVARSAELELEPDEPADSDDAELTAVVGLDTVDDVPLPDVDPQPARAAAATAARMRNDPRNRFIAMPPNASGAGLAR